MYMRIHYLRNRFGRNGRTERHGDRGMRARAENPNKARIRLAAYWLMSEGGLKAASYTAIADRCGLGRPLVQRHFPQKTQFVLDLTEDRIAACIDVLNQHDLFSSSTETGILRVMQLYFSILLRNEQSMNFSREMLSRRDSMSAIIAVCHETAVRLGLQGDRAAMLESILQATGGTAELIVYKIDHGEPIDPDEVALRVACAYKVFMNDERYQEAASSMRRRLLPRSDIDAMIPETIARIAHHTQPAKEPVRPTDTSRSDS